MPNWCENYISISANDDLLEQIHEYVRSENSDFDFEKIIPIPESIYRGNLRPQEREINGENNWYDWSVANWGAEWIGGAEVAESGFYWLKTAWSPCEPIIAELASHMHTRKLKTASIVE